MEIRNILQHRYSENLFNVTKDNTKDTELDKTPLQKRFLSSLDRTLQNYYTNSEIKIHDIAANIAMSERQLYRKLKGVVDMTPSEYLRNYRLEKAKEILADGKSANEASYMVGFSSPSYFSNCFKAYAGCTPSEYLKRH